MAESQRRTPAIFSRVITPAAFQWWAPAFLVDWIVVFAIGLASTYITKQYPYERDVSHYIGDPEFTWPTVAGHERVNGGGELDLLSFYIPLGFVVVISALRVSVHELHHGLLVLCGSRAVMRIIVEFIKNRVGRLRPDFFARCAWDPIEKVCTGSYFLVKDGRRSFPSGHSASSWQGLFFLALFIAGKNGAFAFNATFPRSTILQSRLLRFSIAISPLFLAIWICITRMEDHMHHWQDVTVGSIIGLFSAWGIYVVYFPNPFDSRELNVMDKAKLVYGESESTEDRIMLGEGEGILGRDSQEEV